MEVLWYITIMTAVCNSNWQQVLTHEEIVGFCISHVPVKQSQSSLETGNYLSVFSLRFPGQIADGNQPATLLFSRNPE